MRLRAVGRGITRAFLVAVLLSAAPARAFDFELIVPVRLQSLDRGIAQGKVTCTVYAELDQRVIGGKYVVFPVNTFTGEFERDLVLRFDALPGKNPALASHYRCSLALLVPWANPAWQSPEAARDESLRPREGTAFTPIVSGPLPEAGSAPPPALIRSPAYPLRRSTD